ncbi:putative ABC transporter ATP-binding protein [Actinacidiphila reveromycinica]|uniref:Putative ABC transporter ATP-binding protein n=1 Tax=Actinacidiphila reveromycinica TaxID=659352 RepID=A0A7U3VM13_9ACTN|nr:ATP-binding cassette domain-containing protein [Streptomyces sp. SN-593]BBA96103.1 putative ABC transporter ATP-binding protein [Streptomyces sp. SN-593]
MSAAASPLSPLDRFRAGAPVSAAPPRGCVEEVAAHLGAAPAADRSGTRDEEGPADVQGAFEALGLRARVVTLADDWHRTPLHPLLGYWRDGSPVALLPRGRSFRLVLPGHGAIGRVDAATAADLTPWAWEVTRPLEARRARDLAAHGRRRGDLALLLAAGLAAAVLGAFLPSAGALALSAVLGDRTGLLGELAVLAGFGLGVYAGLVWLRNLVLARLESYAEAVLGPAALDRLLRTRAWRLREYTAGDLAVRVAGVDAVRQMLGNTTLSALLNLLFGAASLVVVIVLAPLPSLPALALVLAAAALSGWFGMRQLRHDRRVFALYGEASSTLLEMLRGLDKIRVAGREERAFGRWLEVFAEQKRQDLAAVGWQSAASGLTAALPGLLYALLLGAPLLLGTAYPGAGGLLALNIALTQFIGSVGQAGRIATAVFGVVPVVDRLLEVVGLEAEPAGAAVPPARRLALRGVGVRAPGGAALLRGVDLDVGPGEFVGVVGASGAGKSTLVQALLGLVPLAEGEVRFDGRRLDGLDPVSARRSLAAVLQDATATGTDIRSTVAAGRPGIDDAAVWAALDGVGLTDEVRAMPLGLATPVGAGNRMVSGGQRQRLLVARALAGRPRLLVLDEATSGLDPATEVALLGRLAEAGPGRIVVTHRVESLAAADRILVLEDGLPVAVGRYAELVTGCPAFARLLDPVGAATGREGAR